MRVLSRARARAPAHLLALAVAHVCVDTRARALSRSLSRRRLSRGWTAGCASHAAVCHTHKGCIGAAVNDASTTAGDAGRRRLVVGGVWGGLRIIDLSDLSLPPRHMAALDPAQAIALQRHAAAAGAAGSFKQSSKVRCVWVSDDGERVAYAVEHYCFVRSLDAPEPSDGAEAPADGRAPLSLACDDKVSCVWGCRDGLLLFTGHFAQGVVVVWCLRSGKRLSRIDCAGGVKDVYGFGTCLPHPGGGGKGLTIAIGCSKAGAHHVSLYSIRLSADSESALSWLRCRSACSSNGDAQPAPAHIDGDDVRIERLYRLPALESVNCVRTSCDGAVAAFGGRGHCISIYRLDTLELCGPSLMMLKRSTDPSNDIASQM